MDPRKPVVIEYIFNQIPRDAAGKLTKTEILQEDVLQAIRACNDAGLCQPPLSHRNPANFFKDIIRHDDADHYWPGSVLATGYTARQTTKEGRVFEFIELPPGQKIAFPNPYYPTAATPTYKVQSVSMTIASKVLGRDDETWMSQVLVKLNVIPTHFALTSPRRDKVLHIDHLQMGIKRRGAEIDSLFMGVEQHEDREVFTLISFEAKQKGERLIHEQIVRQVEEAFKMSDPKNTKRKAAPKSKGPVKNPPSFDYVIPCGVKNMGNSMIYFIEFEAIARDKWTPEIALVRVSEAQYQIEPPVPGLD